MIERFKEAVKAAAWKVFFLTVMYAKWNLSLPPWTRVLLRYSLWRYQEYGENDKRSVVAWNVAMRTTWSKSTAKKYAARLLVYGTV